MDGEGRMSSKACWQTLQDGSLRMGVIQKREFTFEYIFLNNVNRSHYGNDDNQRPQTIQYKNKE